MSNYYWTKTKVCTYCKYSIVHKGETYWKAGTKRDSNGELIRYPLNLHYKCGTELYNRGENLWEWSKKDLSGKSMKQLALSIFK